MNQNESHPPVPPEQPRPLTHWEKIKQEQKEVRTAMHERMSGSLIGAFGLVAGLAWNDAISSAIAYFFPINHDGIWPKFIYAIFVTFIVALFIYLISKYLAPKKP